MTPTRPMVREVRVPWTRRENEVASQPVRPQQREGLGFTLDADEVQIGRNQTQKVVFVASDQQADREPPIRIGAVDPAKNAVVPLPGHRVDMGVESAVVPQVDGLGGQVGPAGIDSVGVGSGQEIGQQDHQVKESQEDQGDERQLVPAEASPGQLPGGRRFELEPNLLRLRIHDCPRNRILGSIQSRSRSEISVPTTVSTPSRSTRVPAR